MTSYVGVRELPLRRDRTPGQPRAYVANKGVILCDDSNKVCHYTQADAEFARARLPHPEECKSYLHACGYWHNGHVLRRD